MPDTSVPGLRELGQCRVVQNKNKNKSKDQHQTQTRAARARVAGTSEPRRSANFVSTVSVQPSVNASRAFCHHRQTLGHIVFALSRVLTWTGRGAFPRPPAPRGPEVRVVVPC